MMGKMLAHYEHMRRFNDEEIIRANFTLIQARLAWEMDSEREFDEERRTLLAACEVLQEQEQISAEFVEFVRTLLAGWSLERLTNITVQAQSLPLTASKLKQEGDLSKQCAILQEFLIHVLQFSQERNIREYGMQALTRLKLEGGIPEDILRRMITIIESTPESLEPEYEEGSEGFEDGEEEQTSPDSDPWD